MEDATRFIRLAEVFLSVPTRACDDSWYDLRATCTWALHVSSLADLLLQAEA